jgi:sulfite reductase (NADPH) flavoprotein alpha-component
MSVEHKQVFRGRHVTNRLLTGPGSGKITRHHEIALDEAPVRYLPGDALGLYPINDPALVERVLRAIGATGDEVVTGPGDSHCTLRDMLALQNLNTPSRRLLEWYAANGVAEYERLLDKANAEHLKQFLNAKDEAHDVLDILEAHPEVPIGPQELAAALRRNLPRLYSVASSQKMHPDQVHLLVVSVRYTIRDRERLGVCSTWIADRWPVGATAEMYLQNQQKHFAMPADPSTPMIMVGPGTGLAPFRAFIQERRATGATGRNWLFFGEQRRASDFFYEEELTACERDGFLRLDLAFSRDQAEKVYVQHRMRAAAADIWRWLEDGAEFFVCGDKERMAADVERELLHIIQTAGGRTEDQAREYIEAMKAAKRYKRDVY